MGCHQWRVYEEDILPLLIQILIERIDSEVLKALNAMPSEASEPDIALTQLLERSEALQKKIHRGNERYLQAPSELMAGLQQSLLGWSAELAEVENQIQTLRIAKKPDVASTFSQWWEGIKGRLVTVREIAWGRPQTQRRPIVLSGADRKAIQKHIGAETGSCRASWMGKAENGLQLVLGEGNVVQLAADGQSYEWFEVECPVAPAILAERDALRALLHQMSAKVTLFWKPKTTRYFEIDRGRVQAEIGGHLLDARTAMPGPRTSIWG